MCVCVCVCVCACVHARVTVCSVWQRLKQGVAWLAVAGDAITTSEDQTV